MTLVAELSVSTSEFALGRVLAEADARASFRTFVPTGDQFLPYLWVAVGRSEAPALTDSIGGLACVDRARTVDATDSDTLVGIEWDDDPGGPFGIARDGDVAIVYAGGTANQWEVHVFCEDRDQLGAFRDRSEAAGVGFELSRLREPDPGGGDVTTRLTDPQFEALRLARERGYFDVPRQATLEELGEDLGISRQAVSNRLRRGTEKLVGAAIHGT